MKRVLFICTKNSARSQMAEGLVNHDLAGCFQGFSAGTDPSSVHPVAIKVMREIGIDISGHRSKSMDEFSGERFDYVITLCDQANESCPVFFGGTKRLHMGFPDPAATEGGEEEKRSVFRKVRDQIRQDLEKFLREEGSERS
jgi:arsenate reductase (thioredoxin)